jgi:hypothetical protein
VDRAVGVFGQQDDAGYRLGFGDDGPGQRVVDRSIAPLGFELLFEVGEYLVVFLVKADPLAGRGDVAHGLVELAVVRCRDTAKRRAEKHFEPGRPGRGELAGSVVVLRGQHRIQAKVHVSVSLGDRKHLIEHRGGVDDGVGVRHRQDRRHTARGGRLRRRRPIFFVLVAGRPGVDVTVDDTREEISPPEVDHTLGGVQRSGGADGDDTAVVDADRDISRDTLGGHDRAVLEQEVVAHGLYQRGYVYLHLEANCR